MLHQEKRALKMNIEPFVRYTFLHYILILLGINMAFTNVDAIETECQQASQCDPISQYCDGFTSKCKQCIDICVTDISKFEKCTDVCKNYLRDNVVRRFEDLDNIYTLVCIIIVITSVILFLLFVLLVLKVRGRKRTKSDFSLHEKSMQMKKLQELEVNQTNGHVIMHSSPKARSHLNLAKGTSMQTMTTAISNVDEEESNHTRRRQPSSSTNNGGGSKRSYQSSSAFYDPPRSTTIRKPSEDRVPQCPSPSNNAAYDNPASSRSPTPTSSNQTLKGSSPNRTPLPSLTRLSSAERGPNSTRLPPIAHQSNGGPRPSAYTISHSQVV